MERRYPCYSRLRTFTLSELLTFAQALELFLPTMLLMFGQSVDVSEVLLGEVGEGRAQCGGAVGYRDGDTGNSHCCNGGVRVGGLSCRRGSATPARDYCLYGFAFDFQAWLGALLMGAVFPKIISTANNYLFSPSTNLVNDVFIRYISPGASNKRVLIVSRLVVVMLGIWALYQALNTSSVLAKTLYAYTIYSAALTPVILAAFYNRRANAQGG